MAERPEEEPTARGQVHPTPALLDRFTRGKATSAERGAIARHLLAGCPRCSALIWPALKTIERLARRRAPQLPAARRRKG